MSFFNNLIPNLNGGSTGSATPPARRPQHTLAETDAAYIFTVYLPGVTKEGLEITDENGELTVVGTRAHTFPEGVTVLRRETSEATFRLVIAHDNAVEAEKIAAELKDGVLQLTLAKAESAKPRKVAVS
jgi:HSP20 family protein